jgi:peroxidase
MAKSHKKPVSHRSQKEVFRRQIRCELLESRQLMAADFGTVHHNHFDPEDVNDDGVVSPADALVLISGLNDPNISRINDPNIRAVATDIFFADVNNDRRMSPLDALMIINRLNNNSNGEQDRGREGSRQTTPSSSIDEVRSYDGTGNNLELTELGSTGEQLLRVVNADYADGISEPAGADRPSPREISNVLSSQDVDTASSQRDLSALIYVWGQFLDHDIDLTDSGNTEYLPILVPEGDTSFDPLGTGVKTIPFLRSVFDTTTGTSVDNPREQVTSITSWIDGSQVYGSDAETAASLREFSGGRMLLSDDEMMPKDEDGFFIGGDIRANENLELTAMQTLWVREHNYWADRIATENPSLDDEAIYQQARAIVGAEIQSITFNEFIPALLGKNAISRYLGYDSTVDPSIANEFSTAAFRFGHSTLNDDVGFFDNDGQDVRDEVSLTEAFLNPALLEESGIDSVLKYAASAVSSEVDLQVVDSLRNLLFGAPGSGGLDLVSLNIQRGRDHGLADYNSVREAYGLEPVDGFDDITSDTELQQNLESLYGSVDNIDLWVGILAEDHVGGGSMGETGRAIIIDQFERLRDGDRFWYENTFNGQQLRTLQNTSLADVIKRNTTVTNLQDNVFFMKAEVTGSVLTTAARSAIPNIRGNNQLGGGNQATRTVGVAGVTVELLDGGGEIIATTTTDSRGRYRFTQFDETGNYSIQISQDSGYTSDSDEPLEFLVTNGATRLRGLDLRVSLT